MLSYTRAEAGGIFGALVRSSTGLDGQRALHPKYSTAARRGMPTPRPTPRPMAMVADEVAAALVPVLRVEVMEV